MQHLIDLQSLGWNEHFQNLFDEEIGRAETPSSRVPGRVAAEHRGFFVVYTEAGEVWAEITGRLRRDAAGRMDLPAVGDWVVVNPQPGENRGVITTVLERRTKFSRKQAGQATDEQVLAANVDHLFVVTALTNELNPRRLERYLTMAWEGASSPVIILTKSDLCYDIPGSVAEVEKVALGVPVHVTSAISGQGLDEIAQYFRDHKTAALFGSSGVGKSSLINRLCGEELQTVHETRSDDRGRHTTTRRELIVLPNGGSIIDTPGMRELQLWSADEGIEEAFSDVAELASACRFNDCLHGQEPGCAVRAAVDGGTLDEARLESYSKLQRELRFLERKQDHRAQVLERRRWKAISKANRESTKNRARQR